MAKGTICPRQNLGKKLERKHTRRDLFQYRNWKLQQIVESIFYRTFKVHSKVTFQSRSTAIFVGPHFGPKIRGVRVPQAPPLDTPLLFTKVPL